jgi:hypothetical protein
VHDAACLTFPIVPSDLVPASSADAVVLRTPRDLSDVLSATFAFLRLHARVLAKSLLYLAAPLFAVGMVATSLFQMRYADFLGMASQTDVAAPDVFFDLLGRITGPVLVSLVFSVLGGALAATCVMAVVRLHDVRGPHGFDARDVRAEVRRLFGRMLVTSLGVGLVVGVPTLIIVIPCLGWIVGLGWLAYAGSVFSLALPMRAMEEGRGFWNSLGRCRTLVKGLFWQTVGVTFVAWLLYYLLQFVGALPATVMNVVYMATSVEAEAGPTYQALLVTANVLSAVVSVLLYALPLVAAAVHYFNLDERQTHAGLMRRVEAVEESVDEDAAAGRAGTSDRTPFGFAEEATKDDEDAAEEAAHPPEAHPSTGDEAAAEADRWRPPSARRPSADDPR